MKALGSRADFTLQVGKLRHPKPCFCKAHHMLLPQQPDKHCGPNRLLQDPRLRWELNVAYSTSTPLTDFNCWERTVIHLGCGTISLSQRLFFKHGLLSWYSGKESVCQCRKRVFYPWVGKIPWRRKWKTTPVLLPGKPHGQRRLAGYSPRSCRVSHDSALTCKHSFEPGDLVPGTGTLLHGWDVCLEHPVMNPGGLENPWLCGTFKA